jgi:hypothetical protein
LSKLTIWIWGLLVYLFHCQVQRLLLITQSHAWDWDRATPLLGQIKGFLRGLKFIAGWTRNVLYSFIYFGYCLKYLQVLLISLKVLHFLIELENKHCISLHTDINFIFCEQFHLLYNTVCLVLCQVICHHRLSSWLLVR